MTFHHLGEQADKNGPDYRLAEAAMLRRFADRLEQGESGYDLGPELILCARMIARQI